MTIGYSDHRDDSDRRDYSDRRDDLSEFSLVVNFPGAKVLLGN